MSSNTVKKIEVISTVKKVLSTIFLMIGLVVVSWTSYISSRPEMEEMATYDGVRHIIVSLFISCLFLFLFVRSQMIHNSHLRRKASESISNKERVKLVLGSFDYWFDCIGLFFMILVFDLSTISPVLAELCESYNSSLVKIKALCMALPMIVLLDFFARYMAIGCWFQTKNEYVQTPSLGDDDPMAKNSSKLAPTVNVFSAMRFLARTYSVNATTNPELQQQEAKKIDELFFTPKAKFKSFIWVILPISSMILLSKYLYSTTVVFGWLLITLICKWQTWTIVGALIGALYLYRILRAFYNRYKFLQRLKKTCRINKYKLSKISNPYSSLFKLCGNQNFYLTRNNKTYSCKFISCIKQNVPLIFHKTGSVDVVRGITFAGVNWFQSTKKFDFEYESTCPQILIINPSMKFVYAVYDGAIKELDNGDTVGKYRVFTGNSFMNAVDRNCIEQSSDKAKRSYY